MDSHCSKIVPYGTSYDRRRGPPLVTKMVLCLNANMAEAKSAPSIDWQFYPRSKKATPLAESVVEAFQTEARTISSGSYEHNSNKVLEALRKHLVEIGFEVESGKHRDERVSVPVLFGRGGAPEKCFDADAYHRTGGFVLEVEAGRGVVNNQFLKDLFQACMMHEVKYLAIAIRKVYRGDKNFETVCRFFDTLYASNRLSLPLDRILVIGY
jgi:hypothetical protein